MDEESPLWPCSYARIIPNFRHFFPLAFFGWAFFCNLGSTFIWNKLKIRLPP